MWGSEQDFVVMSAKEKYLFDLQGFIIDNQGSGNSMANSFCLRINAAANYPDDNSEPVNGVADTERLVDFLLPRSPVEVLVHGFAIDQNRATFI